jgi:hypothetical protein
MLGSVELDASAEAIKRAQPLADEWRGRAHDGDSRPDQLQCNEKVAIANAIVDFVERTGGPVTLAQIEREVAGFKAGNKPSWEYVTGEDQDENLIWDGMTEEAARRCGAYSLSEESQLAHPLKLPA